MAQSSFPHPAPVEARLLGSPRLPRPVAVPADGGVALPPFLPDASPAAALSLAIARAANPGADTLDKLPRRTVDQGGVQCCVSCSLAGVMESLNPPWPALSQMFHYQTTRAKPGGADAQGNLRVDVGIRTLIANGICREEDHQSVFEETGIRAPISRVAVADALTRRLEVHPFAPARFVRLAASARAARVRDEIRANHPVVVVFTLPLGYPDPAAFLNDAHEWVDERVTPSASRHAVLIVGFDDARLGGRGAVEVFDSRGTERFDHGRWWMPYRVLDSASVLEVIAFN